MLHPRGFPLQVVKRVPFAFDSEDWLFEVKHHGFRVLAIRDGRRAPLYTRNGYDISRRHQCITAALAAVPTERFVLDGELVVLDEDDRSNFTKLARGRTGTHYYAFDLLMLGDADLRAKPLEMRKPMLTDLSFKHAPSRFATATHHWNGQSVLRSCARCRPIPSLLGM